MKLILWNAGKLVKLMAAIRTDSGRAIQFAKLLHYVNVNCQHLSGGGTCVPCRSFRGYFFASSSHSLQTFSEQRPNQVFWIDESDLFNFISHFHKFLSSRAKEGEVQEEVEVEQLLYIIRSYWSTIGIFIVLSIPSITSTSSDWLLDGLLLWNSRIW